MPVKKIRPQKETLAYTIEEFAHAVGITRTKTYLEISSGRLKTFTIGRSRLIAIDDAREWLKGRRAEVESPPTETLKR